MTVNDLIRELSELSTIDRTLNVLDIEGVKVVPGNYVDLVGRCSICQGCTDE